MSRFATAVFVICATAGPALAQPASLQQAQQQAPPPKAPPPPSRFDPADYIRIYEESGGTRILLYDPANPVTSLLRADSDSKIVIEIDDKRLSPDMALNSLFINAELSRLDTSASTTNVEVLNYSQIAQDPRTQASQAGVALQTGGDVHVTLMNLYNLTRDLVGIAYEPACIAPAKTPMGDLPPDCHFGNKKGVSDADRDVALRTYLRTFRPRVNAITDFFTNDRNAVVLSIIGDEVFHAVEEDSATCPRRQHYRARLWSPFMGSATRRRMSRARRRAGPTTSEDKPRFRAATPIPYVTGDGHADMRTASRLAPRFNIEGLDRSSSQRSASPATPVAGGGGTGSAGSGQNNRDK